MADNSKFKRKDKQTRGQRGLVAVAKTGVSVFDYENQKRVSPPEAFIQKLSAGR